MTDKTPRTDAMEKECGGLGFSFMTMTAFARQLERELSAAKAETAAAARRLHMLATSKITYHTPTPCPDGIVGCPVSHSYPSKRDKTSDEIDKDFRAAFPEIFKEPK